MYKNTEHILRFSEFFSTKEKLEEFIVVLLNFTRRCTRDLLPRLILRYLRNNPRRTRYILIVHARCVLITLFLKFYLEGEVALQQVAVIA